jgi:DNA polymerase-1
MRTRLLVIDGNHLVYRSHYAKNTTSLQTSTGEASGAFYGSLRTFLALKERFKGAHIAIAFDGGYSGRDILYPGYKITRRGRRVIHSQLLSVQSFLEAVGIPILYQYGIEADDLVSIAACSWAHCDERHSAIIVSSDHDYFQLINDRILLYDDRTKLFYGAKEVFVKTGVRAAHFLWYRCYTGDTADNIARIPGYTRKVAMAAAVGGPPDSTHEHFMQFNLNRQLMRLPHSFGELKCISLQERKLHHSLLLSTFRNMIDEHQHIQYKVAERILGKYEVVSLSVEDFTK